ncbi:MAG: hypothetical protein AAF639_44420 [Chloroflexota bacterium]
MPYRKYLEKRPQPLLAFVDADIVSGKDEVAREGLLNNIHNYHDDAVAPLWVNWVQERADLRFVCLVRDVSVFNDFMLDVVRSVDGVRETRTMLSFGGRADIDTLLDLEMEVSPRVAGEHNIAVSVIIDVEPGTDRECFQNLLDLPNHNDVSRVWLLNCYHSDDADLFLLLLGKDIRTINGYIKSWVRTVPGVIDTEMNTVMDWMWLATPDDTVELCELFFTHNYLGQFREGDRHGW